MPADPKTAVLLMAYGSAPTTKKADVRAYLTHILQFYRRTNPTDDEIKHLQARYKAVGGSPLYDVTGRTVAAVQRALDLAFPDMYDVVMAMKHSPPHVEDVVRALAGRGVHRGIAVALAPFRSRLSTEGYYKLVREVNEGLETPMEWRFAPDWHLHPLFLELWHRRIDDALASVPEREPWVIFTNHSLPARIQDGSDPYPAQFEATARALAERCGARSWSFAYQSAGGGNVPWLGPALGDVLARQIGNGGKDVLVAPIGFLMDHLEVLYDLDVAARRAAEELDVRLHRTRMPNDDPLLVALLADVVRTAGRSKK
jgi:ferrochelatase